MKHDFAIIGATGLQGNIVARDLLERGWKALLCGRDKSRVEWLLRRFPGRARFAYTELNDQAGTARVLRESGADITVNCAEGDFNLILQRLCLKLGQHYLDLGSDAWMTRYQFELDDEYAAKGLCAMTGCGSVPGVGNVMLRHAAGKLDTVDTAEAGFAWTANMPAFVVPFSIRTIIEELTDRPAIIRDGRLVQVAPQAGKHTRTFRGIGRQQVFLTRHSEPYTFYAFLKDKGVKHVRFYAGFPDFSYDPIMTFIRTGLGSKEPVKGHRPVDYLAETLKRLPYPKRYRERENLWVTLTGTRNGRRKTIRMDCIVPTLKGWEEHGCNIDTGLPCAIMAEMVKDGTITARGARSPEFFVPEKPFFRVLARYKMDVYENGEDIN
jgi:saccharopine dehydrogenase-like NADP-dependent oxidoreductase